MSQYRRSVQNMLNNMTFAQTCSISAKSLTFDEEECIIKCSKVQYSTSQPDDMPEKQRFLTIGEAAQFLNVSEVSLRRWTNSGKLRCFRVGGRSERRFLIDDLLAFMSSTAGEPELQSAEVAAFAEPHERHISLFFRNQDEQWQLMRPYLLAY